MAKVHIHIEGESASDTTKELVALAALVHGAGLGGLIDDTAADIAGESTVAPKGRGGRPKKEQPTPIEPAAATPATPAAGAGSTSPPTAAEPASTPATAGPGPSAASTASSSNLTVQDILNEVQELSNKGVHADLVQEKLQEKFGVSRFGLLPKERYAEALAFVRALGATQALA